MSDPQSSPPEPLGYFVPGQMPRQRPLSVTVISVLAILFGTYGALNLQIIEMMMRFQSWNAIWGNQGSELLKFYYLDRFVSGILGVILLIGGILALRLKPSGRRILLYYAVLHLLFGLAGQIMIFSFMLPLLYSQAAQPPTTMPAGHVGNNVVMHINLNFHMAMRLGWLSIIPTVVAICVWASVILVVMTRANVKAAFEPDKKVSDVLSTGR